MLVGRSANAANAGRPDFATTVFTGGGGIGGGTTGDVAVGRDNVTADGVVAALAAGSPGRGSFSTGAICSTVSSTTLERENVSGTEATFEFAVEWPCLQDCRRASRFFVNSHLSTYSHTRLRGVMPVGTSSRVP